MSSLISALKAPLRVFKSSKPRVHVVEMKGAIGVDSTPGRGLSAKTIEASLSKAFKDKDTKMVVLAINSPGGSPAQSRMIMERARQLSLEKQVPLISYIEDVGASGGYMIALAGEEILADPFAIVGSIGVIAAGFGFQDAIEKLGIERRVHTAGTNKMRLDPFREEKAEDREKLKKLLDDSHALFIDLVKKRRGEKILGPADRVFSGDFFLAGEGLELGLVDEIGDLRVMMKDRFGKDVRIKHFPMGRGGIFALFGSRMTGAFVDSLAEKIKGESLRGRYGL